MLYLIEIRECSGIITIQEMHGALLDMKIIKYQGMRFFTEIGCLLENSINKVYGTGSLSCSQTQAVISLLAKFKDKDQSVSLLNVDAKLFSKDLVKRIIKVLCETSFYWGTHTINIRCTVLYR